MFLKRFNFLVFIVTLLASALSWAGREGNGANVVICPGQSKDAWTAGSSQYELLDVYEARVLRRPSLHVDLGAPDLSVEEKIKMALDDLNKIDPYRASIYRKWAREFYADATIDVFDLTPTNDAFNKTLPPGCSLGQLIIQQEPEFPGDKRYLVSKQIWDGLDNDNRATSILHEIVYREAIADGQVDSKRTRYFNSLIFSRTASKLTPAEYLNVLKLTKLVGAENERFFFDGVLYYADREDEVSFTKNGQIEFGIPTTDIPLTVLGNQTLIHKKGTAIRRNDEGDLKICPRDANLNVYGQTLKVFCRTELVGGGLTYFDGHGNLLHTCLKEWHHFKTVLGDTEFSNPITFRPDGSISAGYIWTPLRHITLTDGRKLDLPTGEKFIDFSDDGSIKSFNPWFKGKATQAELDNLGDKD